VSLEPEAADAYFNRGYVHLQRGNVDMAIADLSEVIRLSPGDADAYRARAEAYQAKGDAPSAQADLARVQQLQAARNAPSPSP